MSGERPSAAALLERLEHAIDELRGQLLRYEREIDPDSAYVLSDYLDALALDARDAAADGDVTVLRSVLSDVRQLQRDTRSRLGPDRGDDGRGDDGDEPGPDAR